MIYTHKNIGIITLELPTDPDFIYKETLEHTELDKVYKIHVFPSCNEMDLWRAVNSDNFYDVINGYIEQNDKAHSIIIHLPKYERKKINEKILNIKPGFVKFSWEKSMYSFRFGLFCIAKTKNGYYRRVSPEYLKAPENNHWVKQNFNI